MVELELLKHLQLPNFFLWIKDTESRYIYCNEKFTEAAGAHSPSSMIGKDDFLYPWKKQALHYRSVDRAVMNGSSYINIPEFIDTKKDVLTLNVTKVRLLSPNDYCLGVVCIGAPNLNVNTPKQEMPEKRLYLGHGFGDTYLTLREQEVLRYLLMGYSIKKISAFLSLSSRTVEHFVDILKVKFRCNCKSELIVTAFKQGLWHLLLQIKSE